MKEKICKVFSRDTVKLMNSHGRRFFSLNNFTRNLCVFFMYFVSADPKVPPQSYAVIVVVLAFINGDKEKNSPLSLFITS